jgi:hypothetical protein
MRSTRTKEIVYSYAWNRMHARAGLWMIRKLIYNAPTKDYIKPLQTSYDYPQTRYRDATCYLCSNTLVALTCNILSDSPPSGSSCGQLGLSSADARVASYSSQIYRGFSVNDRAGSCMLDLGCSSFSTDQDHNLCFYYNQTATSIANHYRGNTTEQTLYDVQCFQASESGSCGQH